MIVDLFLIPRMDRDADFRYVAAPINYCVAAENNVLGRIIKPQDNLGVIQVALGGRSHCGLHQFKSQSLALV